MRGMVPALENLILRRNTVILTCGLLVWDCPAPGAPLTGNRTCPSWLAVERDGLNCFRAPDAPVSAAVRKKHEDSFRSLGLVKNLHIDSAAAPIPNDIPGLEVPE